ncbi:MAG: AMP-dependent synthetase/ligase [Promethearchaeota archaeon]
MKTNSQYEMLEKRVELKEDLDIKKVMKKKDSRKWSKYLPKRKFNSLGEMAFVTIRRFGDRTAIRWFDDDEIKELTYKELGFHIINTFHGLRALGISQHDHVAICSKTSPYWTLTDIALQSLGAVSIAIYPSLKPKEMKYILNDSESKCILVDTQDNLEKILSIESEVPTLQYIIVSELFDEKLKKDNVLGFKEFIGKGLDYAVDNPASIDDAISKVREEDLASLIYTSGTTGIPKGVMLTHRNFLSDALLSSSVVLTSIKGEKPWEQDLCCVMPYSHSFGRCVDEYCPILMGASMNMVHEYDPDLIRRAFEEFKPTFMCGIPYLYQKIYNIVLDEVAQYPKMIQNIVAGVIENGRTFFKLWEAGEKIPFKVKLRQNFTAKLVGRIVNKKIGGRWKGMISGSAKLSREVMYFFNTLGFLMAEGYGLTESSPVTHLLRTEFNSDFRPNFNKKINPYDKIGTIGPPIEIPNSPYENIEQKLDPDTGELLIKGPMIMKGYWKKPELTSLAIDDDGWLHTGDIAEIDEDGYVTIKGRAKVVIKLMTGKMISPAAVENLITPASRMIGQFILAGDDSRKYLTAIIVPYQEPLKKYADEHGIKYTTWREIITNEEIQKVLENEISSFLKDTSNYARPKKFLISSKVIDESQYVTPTYKFKRKTLMEDLQKDIDKLYDSDKTFVIIEDRMTDFYDQGMIISG